MTNASSADYLVLLATKSISLFLPKPNKSQLFCCSFSTISLENPLI
jgi:hypothetical protein